MMDRMKLILAGLTVTLAAGCSSVEGDPSARSYSVSLKDKINNILEKDQHYRLLSDTLSKKGAGHQHELDSLHELMEKQDNKNRHFITRLLDSLGMPAESVVGENGEVAIFLVIQHSDPATMEKYLPLFRTASLQNKFQKSHLALLEDRVLTSKGEPQIYGSQLWVNKKTGQTYLLPLRNVDSVDVWRYRMDLGPLNAYLLSFDIYWDPGQYKQILPEIERYWREDRTTPYRDPDRYED